ncbi:DNA-binding response regulator [Pseudoalteromonas rubra]|uniref:DNA-binding response regulator n=1 Tax=Pseudoalteromonas rubra TaxID=43658 RepID=A0A4Q7E6S6_9GAMM|nr:response regulator transcription factor [Pseudoalteromonas rubra]RZM78281.1 DNA-binding response regulator [Pseudoalteromonas rubra]
MKTFMKIIVADDHQIVRQGLLSLIQTAGLGEVIADFDSGEQVWECIRVHEPDLAIMDITLAQLSGLSICRRIKSLELKTRVIFLTTHSDVKMITHALKAGAHGYILKHESFSDLNKAIYAVHSGKQYISTDKRTEFYHHSASKADSDLTARETEIIHYISHGKTNRQIASLLHISAKTVDAHRTRIMKKLNISKTAQLVHYAIKEGILSLS